MAAPATIEKALVTRVVEPTSTQEGLPRCLNPVLGRDRMTIDTATSITSSGGCDVFIDGLIGE